LLKETTMLSDSRYSHCASVLVDVNADAAFDFLADGMNQSYWALGSLERRRLGEDLFVGTSMFDGSEEFIRIRSHRELRLVDYYVGADRDDLRHAVESRVIAGHELRRRETQCVVANTIWRSAAIDDEHWDLLYHLWHTEVNLIKGRLERA
jgi:hypothetical protein